VLAHKRGCPDGPGLGFGLEIIVQAEYHHRDLRFERADVSGSLKTAAQPHCHAYEYDVRAQRADQATDVNTMVGLPNHLQVGFQSQPHPKTSTGRRPVIDQQKPNPPSVIHRNKLKQRGGTQAPDVRPTDHKRFDRVGIGQETEVTMPVRVLIADDHSVVRQGLRMFLALDPELEIVGEAVDGAEAIRMTKALTPDVVLMDLIMPGTDGITATEIIRTEVPDTEVLALTSVLEDSAVVGAIQAGAVGYLLKDTQAEQLCSAIKAAARGQVQLTPRAAARLVRELRSPESPEALTARETEVLRALAKGLTNRQIGRSLHIGERTVKTHVSHLLAKLGLQSRTQAALYAVRIGLVLEWELGQEP